MRVNCGIYQNVVFFCVCGVEGEDKVCQVRTELLEKFHGMMSKIIHAPWVQEFFLLLLIILIYRENLATIK